MLIGSLLILHVRNLYNVMSQDWISYILAIVFCLFVFFTHISHKIFLADDFVCLHLLY